MRFIDQLIVHCAATSPTQEVNVDDIRDWHINGNGWSDIGYHYVICRNGDTQAGRDIEKPGAHAKGYNEYSVGICLVGGVDENGKPEANYTAQQYHSLAVLLTVLRAQYPQAEIIGHTDLPDVDKACPCFNVQAFMQYAGSVYGQFH